MAKSKKTKKNLCQSCTGLCCRYFALPLDTPEEKDDFDDIRWYLCHEGTSVFVEDDAWYINMPIKCKHLSEKDYKCTIYDSRPKICRKYSVSDCDMAEGEYQYELHFTDDKQMQEYIKIKFENNKTEKQKARKKKRSAK